MALIPEYFPGVEGFQWDEGNSTKNWQRHKVTQAEAEEVFLNRPLLIAPSLARPGQEARYVALGRTDTVRLLFVVFTLRGSSIRVVSARPMSRRERMKYEQTNLP